MAYTAAHSKAVVLLLIHCLLLLPLCESVIFLCFVVRSFMSILVCNHLDGEERAGCFAWFVLLVSRDCCVALPCGEGAQWLSGRVLDSRPKGREFEPHRRHCVVVL